MLFAHQNSADKDLSTTRKENERKHNERFLSYNSAGRNKTYAARAKARDQRNVRAARKRFSLRKVLVSPARVADRGPLPSIPKSFRLLRKGDSTRPSQLDLGLAFRTPPHKKDAPATLTTATRS